MAHSVIYIMGVSGSGKTTIGLQLADRTGFLFFDADAFHPAANITKMNAGFPLTDEDRWPWLQAIHHFVASTIRTSNVIMVCSALKEAYRRQLSKGIEDSCKWVLLSGDYQTILNRLEKRADHYMPASLLQSQFEALEVPEEAILVDIQQAPAVIVETILAHLE